MTKRRGKGEGAIYQDKSDGRWKATVELGTVDGKRQRKVLSGKTRPEVAKKLRDALNKLDDGLALDRDGQGPTVEQWLNHWHSTVQRRRLRESSFLSEETIIRRHIVPTLGAVRLRVLQPEQVEALYARLEAGYGDRKPLKPATVLKVHRILSRALTVAEQRHRVARNVCRLVDAPSVEHVEVQPLSQDEARRLLVVAQARRNAARWSVALGLGLRQGEALGMSWDQVDFEQGTLRVTQALGKAHWEHGCSDDPRKPSCKAKRGFLCPERKGHGKTLGLPKSRAGKRVIPLPVEVVEQLRAQRLAQLGERLAAGSEWWQEPKAPEGMSWDLVFRTSAGKPLSHHTDWVEWKDLLKEAGVPDARLHDARHTAATLLLAMGVNPRTVMELMGHSQIALTMNNYGHVMHDVKQDAAEKMSGALWGEPEATVTPLPKRRKTS